MTRTPKIAVIGGGIGGLAAAAILSRDFDVEIFEADAQLGGKIRQTSLPHGPIDCGPTVFTMRWVFDDLFDRAGGSFSDAVSAKPLDILARHAWSDGSTLDLYQDIDKSMAAIEAFSGPQEAQRYRTFCQTTEKMFDTLHEPFMRAPEPNMARLMRQAGPFNLLATAPFSTLWKALERQFTDPRLRQLFGRYATYCGSSPFSAPATLMLIAHVERVGVWTLDGGMYALVEALTERIKHNGAEIHLGAKVARIEKTKRQAREIILENGSNIEADVIVFNGDRAALALGLLGGDVIKAGGNAPHMQRSQSAMTWCLSAETAGFDLSVHNVFFSDAYKAEFDAVFDRQETPELPTTYIFAPDQEASHPTASTQQRLFCLINAPSIGDKRDFPSDTTDRAYENMSALLKQCGLEYSS